MYRSITRLGLGAGILVTLIAFAAAQDKPPPDKGGAKDKGKKAGPKDEYPDYFKTPETAEEFWGAIQFELETGRTELAARLLHTLVTRKPGEKELVALEQKVGSAAFLRLRIIPKWSDDKKIDDQARADAKDLAEGVSKALQAHYGDPARIAKFIAALNGDREDRKYAAEQIDRARTTAVPYLVKALQGAKGEDRAAIVTLLPELSAETVPPLIAALDVPDPELRIDLIDVFVKRGEKSAVPYLWYLSASKKDNPERVRAKATQALAYLTRTDAAKLPPAVVALTREAERYDRHQVAFPVPLVVWRWDAAKKELTTGLPGTPDVTRSRAEEYYGLRFARQALDLEPAYAPAQRALLSLALEKGVERAGLDVPLSKGAPEVAELLATVNPGLIVGVLDRALDEGRTGVVLASVRALGDLAEARATKPTGHGEPALVRALSYPDRRVQFAAAEALLRIPAAPAPTAAGRVVDVLARFAAAEPPPAKAKPKLLVGFATDADNDAVARAAGDAFDVIKVRSGNEALKRLQQAADIDAALIDTQLPEPGLAPLLAQLRQGPATAGVPLWVVPPYETRQHLKERLYEIDDDLRAFRLRKRLLEDERKVAESNYLKAVGNQAAQYKARMRKLDEQLAALAGVELDPTRDSENRDRIERGLLAREGAILDARKDVERLMLTAPADRELGLRRLVERYRHTWVLPLPAARYADSLKRALAVPLADAAGRPLSEAERRLYTEHSLEWLALIARGGRRGYDFTTAEDALYRAVRAPGLSDAAAAAALEALGRLPGAKAGDKPQTELAMVVLDPKRPAGVRLVAADELLRRVQRYSPALTPAQVRALDELRTASGTDPKLREQVALVIGATRPDARLTGERLKDFEPKPPAPPKEDKPKEDKPKEEKK